MLSVSIKQNLNKQIFSITVSCLEIIVVRDVIWNSSIAWPDWPWPPYFTTDLRHCSHEDSSRTRRVFCHERVRRQTLHDGAAVSARDYLGRERLRLDGIDIDVVAREFVAKTPNRLATFGRIQTVQGRHCMLIIDMLTCMRSSVVYNLCLLWTKMTCCICNLHIS